MGYLPNTINKVDFFELSDSYKTCLETQSTIYYNRIAGGMKYNNSDLLRLELIISFLDYTRAGENHVGLDCIFDEAAFPGLDQQAYSSSAPTATGHLQTFINFANQFCKDCITSTPVAVAAVAASTANKLFSQTGTEITLESGSSIILY